MLTAGPDPIGGLPRVNLEGSFAAGNGQGGGADDRAWRLTVSAGGGGGIPDFDLAFTRPGEGAGPWVRHGSNEVADFRRGLIPVDQAVCRGSAWEYGCRGGVLWRCGERAVADGREGFRQQLTGGGDHFFGQRRGGIRIVDGKGDLRHDVAGVWLHRHVVKGDARFAGALDQGPVEWRASSKLG